MEPPSSLGDPLISLPCSSLLLQMLLFTAALSRDLCSCFSLLLLSVSMLSLCSLTYRPKFKFPFPVPCDLHICFPAPSLPAEASLSLTPPKRQPPPPAAAQRGGSRAGSSGRYHMASGACCLSHRHPGRHLWLRLLTSLVIFNFFFLNTIFTLCPFVSFQLKFLCRLLAFGISATPTSFSFWP